MKMKTIEINGINFIPASFIPRNNGKTKLEDLYKNPSSMKRHAFDFWKKELFEIYGFTGNLQKFIIYGRIRDEKDGKVYDVKITKSYNYILD